MISSASKEDIDIIKNINELCLTENYSIDVYNQLLNKTTVCRDKSTGKPIGYVMMADLATEDPTLEPFSHKFKGKSVYTVVFSIAVLPEHRNKGIGSRMLKIAVESFKKYPIVLYSRKSNQIAKKIYNKFGFKVFKKVPNYYHKPEEDGLVLIYLHGTNKKLSVLLPQN